MAVTIHTSGASLIGRRPEGGGGMARIRITNATIVGGRHAPVGSIHDVEMREATALFAAGKAVPCATEPEAPVTRGGEADPGEYNDAVGPACRNCGQDLTDGRRKRIDVGGGEVVCVKCAKELEE